MYLEQTTTPTDTLVTLADAKRWLGITSDDETHDDRITDMLNAVTEAIQNDCGRIFVSQTWTWKQSNFCNLILPKQPVKTVSVTYQDSDNETQTLATDQYSVTNYPTSRIYFDGSSLPSLFDRKDAVSIVMGFETNVPHDAKQLARFCLDHWNEFRDGSGRESAAYQRGVFRLRKGVAL